MSLLDKMPRVKSFLLDAKFYSVLKSFYWVFEFVLQVTFISVPCMVKNANEAAEKQGQVIPPSELEALASFLYVVTAIYIVNSIANWIVSICLCIGVFKQNLKMMEVWLWIELIMLVVHIPFGIYYSIKTQTMGVGIFVELLALVLGIGFRVLCFLSINSYRMRFEKGQIRPYEGNANK